MIYTHGRDNIDAYTQTFKNLWNGTRSSDKELLYEQPACVVVGEFSNEQSVSLDIPSRTLIYAYDWRFLFGHVNPGLITEEVRYWNNELFGDDRRFDTIVDYLRNNLESKRAIVQFWKDDYKDLTGPAACLTAVFFRVDGDRLHIHTHARASNASFLFFMDMQVMRAFQTAVAEQIGKRAGDFVFFTDSLHAYRTESNELQLLAEKMGV